MQNGVTITTSESDLNIVYGPVKDVKQRELALSSAKYILTDLNDIRRNYIKLGFHLYECRAMKYYEDFGFETMEEFCASNFGIDKTTVSRCIDVCLNFSSRRQDKNAIAIGGCKLTLDDHWNMYSYSQLVEMLPLSEEQRLQISPDMTIRQIREYKKSLKNKNDPEPVATSQQDLIYSDTYCSGLFGAVKYNYYKKLSGKLVLFEIVDANGKPVESFYHKFVEALHISEDHILIRLCTVQDDKPENKPGD